VIIPELARPAAKAGAAYEPAGIDVIEINPDYRQGPAEMPIGAGWISVRLDVRWLGFHQAADFQAADSRRTCQVKSGSQPLEPCCCARRSDRPPQSASGRFCGDFDRLSNSPHPKNS
jgi:hypothetical protein